MRWTQKFELTFKSNMEAAIAIYKDWEKEAPKEFEKTTLQPEALANRIGKLRKEGDRTGWWKERPELCQLFAERLELQVSDLLGVDRVNTSGFPEFVDLPSLKPDEAWCPVYFGKVDRFANGSIGWEELIERVGARLWIQVPPGGGKSMLLKMFQLRSQERLQTHEVATLKEAFDVVRNQPARDLLFRVNEQDLQDDADSLRGLESHPYRIVVLASHGFPGVNQSLKIPEKWEVFQPAPQPNWMTHFLRWIGSRLDQASHDSKFDPAETLSWLSKNPAIKAAIRTPGELIALCADFDRHYDNVNPSKKASRWLTRFVSSNFPEGIPGIWGQRATLEGYRDLILAHFKDQSVEMEMRSFDDWTKLLLDDASNQSPPRKPGSTSTVEFFKRAGLLRSSSHGIQPYPIWVSTALTHEYLHREFRSDAVDHWGRLVADQSRQKTVDDALDSFHLTSLRALGCRIKDHFADIQEPSFTSIAALEAITAAFARRSYGKPLSAKDAELAGQLLELQKRLSVKNLQRNEEGFVPLTRLSITDWIVTGWAISLATPDAFSWDKHEALLAPGWVDDLSYADLKELAYVELYQAGDEHSPLVQFSAKLVERCVDEPAPGELPRILILGFLLSEKRAVLPEQFVELRCSTEQQWIASYVAGMKSNDERTRIATKIWELLGRESQDDPPAPVARRLGDLKHNHEPLVAIVLDNLPDRVIEQTARIGVGRRGQSNNDASLGLHDASELDRLLSSSAKSAVVRGWLSAELCEERREIESHVIAQLIDDEALGEMLDCLHGADANIVAHFAGRIWSANPELALEQATQALAENHDCAFAWFLLAPRAYLGTLLDEVDQAECLPAWIQRWAHRRLLEAGPSCERLFRLAKG